MCIQKLPINVKNVTRIFHLKAYIKYMCEHTLDQKFINVLLGPATKNTSGHRTYIVIYKHI